MHDVEIQLVMFWMKDSIKVKPNDKNFQNREFHAYKNSQISPGRFIGLSSLKWMDLGLFYDEFYRQMV